MTKAIYQPNCESTASKALVFAPQNLAHFRQRILDTPPADIKAGWEDVLIPQGVLLAAKAWQDAELFDWVDRWLSCHSQVGFVDWGHFLPPEAGIPRSGYCGHWGFPLVAARRLADRPDERQHQQMIDICEYILHTAKRLRDGILAHAVFPQLDIPNLSERAWVDTLYYSSSVLAETYTLTGNDAYLEEAGRQCLLHAKYLQDKTTGAFFHDIDPATGIRPLGFWSRGNGWIILGLADTLRHAPEDWPMREEILDIYRTLATALLRWQHPCGLWRIMPDVAESHLETSGTAMIAGGLAIGIGEGWLEPSVSAQVRKAIEELVTWVNTEGRLQGAQRPAGMGGWETHKLSTLGECTYATGFFLRLLAEAKNYNLLS